MGKNRSTRIIGSLISLRRGITLSRSSSPKIGLFAVKIQFQKLVLYKLASIFANHYKTGQNVLVFIPFARYSKGRAITLSGTKMSNIKMFCV